MCRRFLVDFVCQLLLREQAFKLIYYVKHLVRDCILFFALELLQSTLGVGFVF